MSTATKPDWRYRLAFTMLAPLIAWHSIAQARQLNETRMARQKLGKDIPQRHDRPLWLHMASVGEVNAAYPLLLELRRRYPKLPVIVTTFTPTGAENARKKFGAGIEHIYLPLDFDGAVNNFLQQLKPRCALIMETEIWPRLFYHCKLMAIPLLIVNGRLSPRTLAKPAWVRTVYRRALQNVERVLARSEKDAQHFIELGMSAQKVEVIGNIKFAAPEQEAIITPIPLPRPYIVAASTHADEELQLSRAWLNSGLSRDYLLVIVPRHPQRKAEILQQLRPLTARLAVRSDNNDVSSETQIYLADTFGELQGFMAGSELVCIGGSFIPRGGQNVIEAARLGKVALFGPHMENFADECGLLLHAQAALQVNGSAELIEKMAALLAQPQLLHKMGQQARELVAAKADVAADYAAALEPYLQEDNA